MEWTTDLLASVCALVGSLFVLSGAIALLRFPDVYTRFSGGSKAGTAGVGCLLLGMIVADPRLETVLGATLLGAFLFMTLPLAAHAIGRAAYRLGTPPHESTCEDALAEHLKRRGRDARSASAGSTKGNP